MGSTSDHSRPPSRPPLILLAHGSPDPRHAAALTDLAHRIARARGNEVAVSCAFLQHHPPALRDALTTLLSQGAATAAVYPLFLTQGDHWRRDIPDVLSGVDRLQLLDPPAPSSLVDPVLAALSEGSVARPEAAAPDQDALAIHLVAAGSRANDLTAYFAPLAKQVQERLTHSRPVGTVTVRIAESPQALPTKPDPARTQIWVPLLVAPGRLNDIITTAANDVGAQVCPAIGQTTAFAELIAAATSPDP